MRAIAFAIVFIGVFRPGLWEGLDTQSPNPDKRIGFIVMVTMMAASFFGLIICLIGGW